MRIIIWLFRIFVFLLLFAFALNNQHEVALKGFFGLEWRTPMIFVVLGAFAAGCVLGAVAFLPGWWRQRRLVAAYKATVTPAAPPPAPSTVSASAPPPRTSGDVTVPAHVREGI